MKQLLALAFAILFGLQGVGATGSPPKLDLDRVAATDNSFVEFHPSFVGQEASRSNESIGQSDDFQVYAGDPVCSYSETHRQFRYELFFKSIQEGRWLHFTVNAIDRAGSFVDRFADVPFALQDGARTSRGTVRLPLHGSGREPLIGVAPLHKPTPVRLGGDTPIPIEVQNRLGDMDVVLQAIDVHYDTPSLWVNAERRFVVNQTIAAHAADRGVTIDNVRVHLNTYEALGTSLQRFGANPDSKLTLTFEYAAQSGGQTRVVPVDVYVQIQPNVLALLLAAIGGGLAGAFMRLIEGKARRSWNAIGWGFLAAALGPVVIELLAIGLRQAKCALVLFDWQPDPFQIPHVIGASVLVGLLGVNVSTLVQRWLKIAPNDDLEPKGKST